MGDMSRIDPKKTQDALASLMSMESAARQDWKSFVDKCPRRPNKAQAERIAFLRGRLSGLHEALREFEMRSPIEWQETR